MTKKPNTGLILLLLGGAGFLYWKYLYIGAGDIAAGENYFKNRNMSYTIADVMALLKKEGKDWVVKNQVPNYSGTIQNPINVFAPITTMPVYNTPTYVPPVTSIVDTPIDSFDEYWDVYAW
jgi:uncharacterized membrane protein